MTRRIGDDAVLNDEGLPDMWTVTEVGLATLAIIACSHRLGHSKVQFTAAEYVAQQPGVAEIVRRAFAGEAARALCAEHPWIEATAAATGSAR